MSEYSDGSNYSIKTFATGRESHINCDMVMCVLKKSIGRYLGTAPKEIMDQVDTALENVFELGYVDDDKEAEIERLKEQVAKLEQQVASKEESIIARGREIANMNAKYNKAVDRIVELELNWDIAQRIAEKKAEPIVEEQEEKVDEPPIEPKKAESKKEFVRQPVNVNTASCQELCEKLGFSKTIGYKITSYRKENGAFVDVEELRDVPQITKPMFERIKDYIVIEEESESEETNEPESEELEVEESAEEEVLETEEQDVPVEKLNINTASIKELVAIGFTPKAAAQINRTRKTRGPFKRIDELSREPDVKAKDLRKLRDKLEV
jgi:competence ComEA-like helix-hairpin-helix protein